MSFRYDLFTFFHPFKVEEYRRSLNIYYRSISSYGFEDECLEACLLEKVDLVQKIISISYGIFRDAYRQKDFEGELLQHVIETYRFSKESVLAHDFRDNKSVKCRLKESLSDLKNEGNIADEEMNALMVATWDAFVKFKIFGSHEIESRHYKFKITSLDKIIIELNKSSVPEDVW